MDSLIPIITWLIVGAIGGWLASFVMTRDTTLRVNDIVLGMLGAVVGGWLFGVLGLTLMGNFGPIVTAFVGALLLAWIYRMVTGRSAA